MIDGKQYVSILGGGTGNGRLFTIALDADTPLSPHRLLQATARARQHIRKNKPLEEKRHTRRLHLHGVLSPAMEERTVRRVNGQHVLGHVEWALRRATCSSSSAKPCPGSPNTLKPDVYTDILAYIMQVNKMPAGQDQLKNDPAALERVIISVGNGGVPRDVGQGPPEAR